VRVTWRIPNLLLTSALAPLLARAPGTAHAALSGLARRIIDGVASEPLAAHRIEPALGRWPDPLPFFAWCGLAQEWTEASRAADLRRREHLREQAALLRRRLRAPELAAQERSRLMNAVNVQIPRLLGGA